MICDQLKVEATVRRTRYFCMSWSNQNWLLNVSQISVHSVSVRPHGIPAPKCELFHKIKKTSVHYFVISVISGKGLTFKSSFYECRHIFSKENFLEFSWMYSFQCTSLEFSPRLLLWPPSEIPLGILSGFIKKIRNVYEKHISARFCWIWRL